MRRHASLLASVPALVVLVAAACGTSPHQPEVARKRTTFDVVIRGTGDPSALPSEHGGTITLTEAKISLGAPEWFEGDALFALRTTPVKRDAVQAAFDAVLAFSSAHAHPGHYTPGEALADLDTIGVVDLLAGDVAIGTAEGVTGAYGTLSLPFASSPALEGAAVKLAGSAHCTSGDVPFWVSLPLDKIIEGVPSAIEVGTAGTVTIDVSLEDLVRRIDFTSFPTAETVDLLTVDQARNSVERSVESQATYTVTYQE
jgi:hypothetical protein